jgi:hypothetical protein
VRVFSAGALTGLRVRFQRPALASVDVADRISEEDSRPASIPRSRIAPAVDPLFALIIVVGSVLRLADLNWDQGTHIHPDERFLTMLGTAVNLPGSLLQYFDPVSSPLSPYNTSSYSSMVYGMLPITLNKLLAAALGNGDFGMFVIQGRALSALADIGTLVFVFLIVRLLAMRGVLPLRTAYLAAALYAVSVLPIQLAHFFTVDSFLNVFAWGAVYFALRYALGGGYWTLVMTGLLLGLSFACKVSGIYMVPVVGYLVVCRVVVPDANPIAAISWIRGVWRDWRAGERAAEDAVFALVILAAAVYIGLRLGAPYYFESANPLDPRLGHAFLSNLQSFNAYNSPDVWYPPGVQWIHKPPVTFALVNLAVFGLGVPIFLAAVAGSYVVVARLLRTPLSVLLLWAAAFFLYQSTAYVKTMRYFILLYPALAIFAGVGLAALLTVVPRYIRPVLALSLVIWPLAFMSIYTRDLSRVTASQWMYRNLPNGAYIVNESWDDPLPLQIPNSSGKSFSGTMMSSFDWDTPAKWQKMRKILHRADYLVLSSNRGWGSIPTDPKHYPRMTAFYRNLFAGRTAFREVASFTSYPSLRYLGIPIDFPDQWSEEAFTVYDHPEVLIFEHVR